MAFKLLDVRIDTYTRPEVLAQAREALLSQKQLTIFTPNPEMLVKAQTDSDFKQALNRGDINICDGKGIQLFAPVAVERITGVDLMIDLCALAENEGKSVFLLGSGREAVLQGTVEKLQQLFPKLKIAGTHPGNQVDETALAIDTVLVEKISASQPDVLFVAFGMGKQEKWILRHLPQLPSVKVASGVGGSFDFVSGQTRRAPLLLQKLGLEWLYRLFRQPWRFWRICNATLRFTYLVLCSKV